MLIISDMDTNDKDDSYADIIMNITNRVLIMLLSSSSSVNITIIITHRSSSSSWSFSTPYLHFVWH